MYVTDQPEFLNAVCELQTALEPKELLHALKETERSLGRSADGPRNGPRPIDLDIVLYGDRAVTIGAGEAGSLQVPHARLGERDFVLRPLCDIDRDVIIPGGRSASDALAALEDSQPAPATTGGLRRVTPLQGGRMLHWDTGRTLLMGILNATPDSFSDGGKYTRVDAALVRATELAEHGFDMIDVGGQSTRPGAADISGAEEIARVTPIISAIRAEHPKLPISIDTFRSAVATAALEVGSDIINDVSAGTHDSAMAGVAARHNAPWILMHRRGTARTMDSKTGYGARGVAHEAGAYLRTASAAARTAGIPRWALLADGGVGFAKSGRESAELLRDWRSFAQTAGLPTVLGASRKRVLRAVGEQDWATAGAVAAAVARGGVDVVRIHASSVATAVRAADLVRNGV